MKGKALLAMGAIAAAAFASSAALAAPVACTAVTGVAASNIPGNSNVKSSTAALVAASGPNAAYCRVDILYGENASQNINIRVSLPLNSVDGGTGGTVQGAWNGRTQAGGGGGCSGGLGNNNGQVNTRYVGASSDGGHTGGDCEPGVNLDGTYNLQFINDFIRNGMKQQVLFMKSVARAYYGMEPLYNYWNGCSTGGRQGYVIAQELPKELQGILANAPAMYWTRFQTAQMWGQIVMKDLTGGPIPTAKQNFATAKALAACDGNDGVVDGVIDDPRTCNYSAVNDPSAICVANGGTSVDPNCLTLAEAQAMDKIWDGPRNSKGQKIWFHSEKGSGTTVWNGTNPFALAVVQFHWDEHDRTFDWHTVTMFGAGGTMSYADVHQDGSRNIADVTDTFGDLKGYKKAGGKLLTMVGAYDNFIMPRGVIHYYRLMADKFGGFEKLQEFYRLFRAPGVGHCAGGVGPQPQNLFQTLVDWVENGVVPNHVLGINGPVSAPTRTRKICSYPQWAIYNGTGSTDDQANFTCGGNLETPATVCADVLTKYKHEVNGPLDFKGTKLNAKKCSISVPWNP